MITKTKSYFIFREFMYQLHILDLKRIVGYVILEKNKTKWKGEVKQSKAKVLALMLVFLFKYLKVPRF